MNSRQVKYSTMIVLAALAALLAVLSVRIGVSSVMFLFVSLSVVVLFVEPFAGVLILVVLLTLRPHAFVPGLRGMPVVLVIGTSTFVSMVLRAAIMRGGMWRMRRMPQDWILMWFVASLAWSHVVRLDIAGAGSALVEFAPVLIVYFCITNLVTTKRRIDQVLRAVVVSSVALALVGLGQEVGILRIPGVGGEFSDRMVSVGIARDPNIFALTLLAAVPLAARMTGMGAFGSRMAAWAYLVVLVGSIYLSNSRGAIVGLVATSTFYVIWRRGIAKGAVVAALLIGVLLISGPSRFGNMDTEMIGDEPRLKLWQAGLDTFARNPMFGVGAFSWYEATKLMVPHNSLIHCAGELGIFGLFPWVMLIVVSIKQLFGHVRRGQFDGTDVYESAHAIFYSAVAFLVGAFFLSQTYYYLLYLQMGLAACVTSLEPADERADWHRLGLRTWLYTLGVILGLLGGLALLVRMLGER